jgi:hypothetical protein
MVVQTASFAMRTAFIYRFENLLSCLENSLFSTSYKNFLSSIKVVYDLCCFFIFFISLFNATLFGLKQHLQLKN